jgi:hypothetical protein
VHEFVRAASPEETIIFARYIYYCQGSPHTHQLSISGPMFSAWYVTTTSVDRGSSRHWPSLRIEISSYHLISSIHHQHKQHWLVDVEVHLHHGIDGFLDGLPHVTNEEGAGLVMGAEDPDDLALAGQVDGRRRPHAPAVHAEPAINVAYGSTMPNAQVNSIVCD